MTVIEQSLIGAQSIVAGRWKRVFWRAPVINGRHRHVGLVRQMAG
jgi:hypothetical protein